MLTQKIKDYLAETLGVTAALSTWGETGTLPYFLRDAYDFQVLELLGHQYLLMTMTEPGETPLAEIRRHLDNVTTITGHQIIFATETITSSERKRLIEHKVPFIVPGNQLYLHDLGIDLREHFMRHRKTTGKPLSPSTQAILITALLRPWNQRLHPNEVVASLGYTAMTASRAMQEISGAGVATIREGGRERWLEFDLAPSSLWERLEMLLRSPVKRTVWAHPEPHLANNRRLAGMSALASLSMIADPKYPVYAVSQEQWKLAQQQGIKALLEPTTGCCEWQIWRYPPALMPDQPTVDPLSLQLSLKDSQDERIESALESLRKHLPW